MLGSALVPLLLTLKVAGWAFELDRGGRRSPAGGWRSNRLTREEAAPGPGFDQPFKSTVLLKLKLRLRDIVGILRGIGVALHFLDQHRVVLGHLLEHALFLEVVRVLGFRLLC